MNMSFINIQGPKSAGFEVYYYLMVANSSQNYFNLILQSYELL